MPLARVKSKFQVTLASEIRERANLAVGDLVETSVTDDGDVLLRPKRVVDRKHARDVAEARADYAAGRGEGPFSTVEEGFGAPRNTSRRLRKR